MRNSSRIWIYKSLILIGFIGITIIGIVKKDYIEVLRRGILLCLECIGIG